MTATDSIVETSPAGLSPLDRRLAEPIEEVALADLAVRWFHAVITARCAGGGHLVADPALPGRVRGAWGERLKTGASAEALAGGPCPWDPPCALDVFLRERASITGRLKVPQPYVVATVADRGDLLVRLTVMGFATDWTDTAAEALVAALRGGIFDGTTRRPFTVVDRSVETLGGLEVPATAHAVALHFHSPLALRSGEAIHGSTAPLLTSLGNRVSGLARWLDSAVIADWPSIKTAAAALERDESGLTSVTWQRRSTRQGGRVIPMGGLAGTLILTGELGLLLPLLALGTLTHAGSHAAQGMGLYNLEVVR